MSSLVDEPGAPLGESVASGGENAPPASSNDVVDGGLGRSPMPLKTLDDVKAAAARMARREAEVAKQIEGVKKLLNKRVR
mgnify:CR=1 FL=1